MTQDIKDVLKLALEFIENSECGTADLEARIKEALRENAMREVQRLGQEIEQEPVALEAVYETIIQWDEGGGKRSRRELARRIVALYNTPPQQEPVAWMHIQGRHQELSHLPLDDGEISRGWEQYPLYTTPPQRTWVGLTEEEKSELWEISRAAWPRYITYASLAEAKLKEKNT